MNRLRGKLTYSNVMVTVLAVIVLGGGSAYAASKVLPKNSVGTRQIKAGAVTTAKLKNGSVTGAKVTLSSLGTVPSAAHADTADSASHAVSAGTADSANRADSAATAGTATSALDSAALGGVGPAGYQARTMWAYVDGNGQILSQSGGISVQAHIKGATWLDFPQRVGGKGIVATPWAGAESYESGIEVAPCGYLSESATPASIACDHGTNTLSDMFVATQNEGTAALLGFYVVVVP